MKIDTIIKLLEELTPNHELEDIQQVIEEITIMLSSMINSTPLFNNIKIYKNISNQNIKTIHKDFYKLGINRKIHKNTLILEITGEFPEFFPIFLLREAYLRFIPLQLKDFKFINIFIDQFIQEDLSHLKLVEKWKEFVEKQVLNKKLLDAHMDRIGNFFMMKSNQSTTSPRSFFFEYVRRNAPEIREDDYDIFEKWHEAYQYEGTSSLEDLDVLNTIRDLFKIFMEVKSYRALLDYKRFFQKFKKEGLFDTDLSLSTFTEKVRWITQFTYIAPSYLVNWDVAGYKIMICLMYFNPIIDVSNVIKILNFLPFFQYTKHSMMEFSTSIVGFFTIPQVYIKDLKIFLDKLREENYLLNFLLFTRDFADNLLNLNYMIKEHKFGLMTNPNDTAFRKDFLLKKEFHFSTKRMKRDLTFLDFIIAERSRFFSATGLPFERRSKTLRLIREDFYNKELSSKNQFMIFKNGIQKIRSDPQLSQELLKLIKESNFSLNFNVRDYIYDLLQYRQITRDIFKQHPNFKSLREFLEFIKQKRLVKSIFVTKILNDEKLRKQVFKESSYHSIIDQKKYKIITKRYKFYLNFLDSCLSLNIMENVEIMNLIAREGSVEKFIEHKTEEFKIKFKKRFLSSLTSDIFEKILEDFTTKDPVLLHPSMLNTFSTTNTVSKTFYSLLISYSRESLTIINQMRYYFPRSMMVMKTNEVIYLEIFLPTLNKKEKLLLYHIISTNFTDKLIYFRRLFTTGLIRPFSIADYYDFLNKECYYNTSLFPQLFSLVQRLIKKPRDIKREVHYMREVYSIPSSTLSELTESLKKKISEQAEKYDIHHLTKLHNFHQDLNYHVLNIDSLENIKNSTFFTNFVEKISFLPDFAAFGLSQYFLYIRPLNIKKIDLKFLLSNTFQKVETTTSIDGYPLFFIKYLFPLETPNKSHLNRMRGDNHLSEYCLFRTKKVYNLLHFDRNLSSDGWDADTKISEFFKIHAQRILFGSYRDIKELNIKEFSLSNVQDEIYGPDSKEFSQLMSVYSRGAANLKSYMNDVNFLNKIESLTRKNLLFFYLRLRNLDLQERITIIIPEMSEKYNETLLKIFYFFNDVFIFEIEGEHYIIDDPSKNVKKIKNGFMIKLRLPSMQLSILRENIIEVFEVMDIKSYIIFTDLIDFSFVVEKLFSSEELEAYQPLNNLIWDERSKSWKNIKLYGEGFIKKYPPLSNTSIQ